MTAPLPPLPSWRLVHERLPVVFPEGTEHRGYLTREMAAKTIFVLFYVGAVEGTDRWLRPDQVTRMSDAQAGLTSDSERMAWAERSRGKQMEDRDRWYRGNTREPIRDETLRNALKPLGAVVERAGLPTTSSRPRWALVADFADLFTCPEAEFTLRAEDWRQRHLSQAALLRMMLRRRYGHEADQREEVVIGLPTGGIRRLPPGPSSLLAKAVVEEFTPRFLREPGVLWLSDSSRRDEGADLDLARQVGLHIDTQQVLPDLILVDLEADRPRFVFVELVSSDGPVTTDRKARFLEILKAGGHSADDAAFMTVFADRGDPAFRKVVPTIAWSSFTWFASEPDKIVAHHDLEHTPTRLFDLRVLRHAPGGRP